MANELTKEEKAQEVYAKQQEYVETLIADGTLPKIRMITRKQRKALDKANLNYLKLQITDKRNPFAVQEDCYDWILDTVYKEHDFSNLPNNVCLVFARMTFASTYQDELAEKN